MWVCTLWKLAASSIKVLCLLLTYLKFDYEAGVHFARTILSTLCVLPVGCC